MSVKLLQFPIFNTAYMSLSVIGENKIITNFWMYSVYPTLIIINYVIQKAISIIFTPFLAQVQISQCPSSVVKKLL